MSDTAPPCRGCGGPHPFDTTLPSVTWNALIRSRPDYHDYLCTTCIVREAALAEQSFTAELWGEEFDGLPIEVRIRGVEATTSKALNDQNAQLRYALAELVRVSERAMVGRRVWQHASDLLDKITR